MDMTYFIYNLISYSNNILLTRPNGLGKEHILCRRYLYSHISEFFTSRGLPSASKENLPVANQLADTVLCSQCIMNSQTKTSTGFFK